MDGNHQKYNNRIKIISDFIQEIIQISQISPKKEQEIVVAIKILANQCRNHDHLVDLSVQELLLQIITHPAFIGYPLSEDNDIISNSLTKSKSNSNNITSSNNHGNQQNSINDHSTGSSTRTFNISTKSPISLKCSSNNNTQNKSTAVFKMRTTATTSSSSNSTTSTISSKEKFVSDSTNNNSTGKRQVSISLSFSNILTGRPSEIKSSSSISLKDKKRRIFSLISLGKELSKNVTTLTPVHIQEAYISLLLMFEPQLIFKFYSLFDIDFSLSQFKDSYKVLLSYLVDAGYKVEAASLIYQFDFIPPTVSLHHFFDHSIKKVDLDAIHKLCECHQTAQQRLILSKIEKICSFWLNLHKRSFQSRFNNSNTESVLEELKSWSKFASKIIRSSTTKSNLENPRDTYPSIAFSSRIGSIIYLATEIKKLAKKAFSAELKREIGGASDYVSLLYACAHEKCDLLIGALSSTVHLPEFNILLKHILRVMYAIENISDMRNRIVKCFPIIMDDTHGYIEDFKQFHEIHSFQPIDFDSILIPDTNCPPLYSPNCQYVVIENNQLDALYDSFLDVASRTLSEPIRIGIDCEWVESLFQFPWEPPVGVDLVQLGVSHFEVSEKIKQILGLTNSNNMQSRYCFFLRKRHLDNLKITKIMNLVFSSKAFKILGFAFHNDLKKLDQAFPHLKTDDCQIHDLSMLYPKENMSLSKLVEKELSMDMKYLKDVTMSNWQKKFLSQLQLRYGGELTKEFITIIFKYFPDFFFV